jgi:hypothetical protein
MRENEVIMTDREKLIELIAECKDKYPCRGEQDYREFKEYLADFLLSKGVTIPVRCGECRHWDLFSINSQMGFCIKPLGTYDDDIETHATDFCSCGERKEE